MAPSRHSSAPFPVPALLALLLLCLDHSAGRSRVRRKEHAPSWYIPAPQTSFFWQLQGTVDTKNPASVLDLDGWETSAATISTLHKAGKRVICYFSVGSFEDWREDANKFPESVKGAKLCAQQDDKNKCVEYWPRERWLDIRSPKVRAIMEARIKMGAAKGCDGIEPDNVDAYSTNTEEPAGKPIAKFRISRADEVAYLKWLAHTAHKNKMSIGLKNAGDLAPDLLPLFDWALSEECNYFTDSSQSNWYQGKYPCDYLNLFIKAGKAAFVAEYSDEWSSSSFFPKGLCSDNNAHGFTTLEFDRDLKGDLFPAANCLEHQPTGCAAGTWKTCIHPKIYETFTTDSSMTDADKIGQCVRAKTSRHCRYK